MDDPLVGARLRRLAVWKLGGREVALLDLRVPPRSARDAEDPAGRAEQEPAAGENAHVVLAAGIGVGVVDAASRRRLRAQAAQTTSAAQVAWRARLDGGRIAAIDARGVTVETRDRSWRAAVGGAAGTLVLDEAKEPSPPVPDADVAEREVVGRRVVETLATEGTEDRRGALARALSKALAKVRRRADAIRGDLARARDAAATSEQARLFVEHAARAPSGTTRLEAVDWSSGEARAIEMAIDPARRPKEQLDALFARAKRLRMGMAVSQGRLDDAERAIAALASLQASLASGAPADLEVSEALARAAAPRDFRLGARPTVARRARRDEPLPPHRTFLGAAGARILVGRAAAHNDALTFHVARPHDLWLHAKGRAGAHVVVPLAKNTACPADVLVEAAHLAAHFSDARDEDLVEVLYTPRKYVRKPRGSAPGLVVVDREKVIVLRRQAEVLRQVLERELDARAP